MKKTKKYYTYNTIDYTSLPLIFTLFCIKDENSMSATGNYKLVLVVRSDLKMGKGKIAAQVEEYFKLELVLWFQWFIL